MTKHQRLLQKSDGEALKHLRCSEETFTSTTEEQTLGTLTATAGSQNSTVKENKHFHILASLFPLLDFRTH